MDRRRYTGVARRVQAGGACGRVPAPSSQRRLPEVFEQLSERVTGILKKLTGQARLTPDNIRESMREVRRALLEADVPIAVAKEFVARVEERAVREELEKLLGNTTVNLAGSPHLPTVVLLAGLQGSGKTTFAGKLALWLK